MHTVHRNLYVFTILYGILTFIIVGLSGPGAEPTDAFALIYGALAVLLFVLSIVTIAMWRRDPVPAVHKVLPIYYVVKMPLAVVTVVASVGLVSGGSIGAGVGLLLLAGLLQLLTIVESIWAIVMLVIARKA